jgi:hypothetical protein
MINVQFADSTNTSIISYLGCPQDPKVWSNLGTVATNDDRWKSYYDAQSTFIQQYLPSPSGA